MSSTSSSSSSAPPPSPSTAPLSLIPGKTRIGWIGTGVMGTSMCAHLLKLIPSYTITVYNRTRSKTAALEAAGATIVESPQAVAAVSDIVFSIVAYPSDVRSTYLGANGILSILRPGSIVVDMTTSEPSLAVEIAKAASEKSIYSIDAPVSGGDIGARNGTLSIMVGTNHPESLEVIRPLFLALGKNITLCGSAGAGQHTKMTNQILIASNMIGVCEGLLYATRAGLDPTTVITAVSAGAAGSWSISNLGPRIVARNFDPGFYVEHFLKDMGIALDECKRMGIALPGLGMAYQLYTATKAQGHGKLGTQSLMLALEHLSGIKGTIGGNAGAAAAEKK